jgi:hypothetical protein
MVEEINPPSLKATACQGKREIIIYQTPDKKVKTLSWQKI